MHEVDFSLSDLNAAKFEDCDLFQATFFETNLTKADLSSSHNYSIDPENNQIQKARFSLDGLPGLLEKYQLVIS